MNNKNELPESNRRDFLKNASLASMMAMVGGVELRADEPAKPAAGAEPALTEKPLPQLINVGVIGLNEWGREILKQLALLPADATHGAHVVAICDNYPAALRRAGKDAPNAQKYDDYTKLLADPSVQAVIIATPTATHKEIALAALAAGKYVMVRAQWHQNTTWYRTAPTPEREDALNWRLHKATSTGLIGEEGIHQIDTICSFLQGRPTAVTGF